MKNLIIKNRLFTATLLITLIFSSLQIVSAQNKPGVSLSPAFNEVIILKNSKNINEEFFISNDSGEDQEYIISAIDMGALDETGGVILSGLDSEFQKRYGLADWIKLTRDKVLVKNGSTEGVDYKITNDSKLQPGGHYGAIVLENTSTKTAGSGNNVSLTTKLTTLIFAKKIGGEKYSLKIAGIQPDKSILYPPEDIKIGFVNNGNVHVVPRGVLYLNNKAGKEVAKGIINPESSIIFPGNSRTLLVKMQYNTKLLLPGTYKYDVQYRFDGESIFASYSSEVRIYNLVIIGASGLALFGISFLVIAYYKRYIRNMRLKSSKPRRYGRAGQSSNFVFWPTRGGLPNSSKKRSKTTKK